MFDAYFSEMESIKEDYINKYKSIIKHKDTKRIYLKDFPNLESYLNACYDKINFDNVSIYLTTKKQFNKVGMGYAAGFFLNEIKSIFILDQIKTIKSKFKYKLDQLIFQNKFINLNQEDVLIHELMHYISSCKRNNGNFEYKNMEEEFAYTSCIKYYLANNKSEEDIKNIIFPFCVSAIFEDKDKINSICIKTNIDKKDFFNAKNATLISKFIIEEAKNYVDEILRIYHTKGVLDLNTTYEPYDDMRFSLLGEI